MASKPDAPANLSKSMVPEEDWAGKLLGRFKLLRLIGKGAMGRVFRAEDVTLKRQVALKIFPQKITKGERTYKLEQFIREARSAAALEHPHVVHIYEVGQAKGWYYIAMELLEGGSLLELVEAGGPMDQFRACTLCADAAEGLGYAHRLGIIHRDVKPANLMLTRAGRCKVTDFGLARLDDPNDPFSMPSEAVGTPLYVPPEVIGGTPAGPASDIYSLGATLFFMLMGRPPFGGKTQKEVLLKHRKEPIPDLRKLRPELPESLVQAIEKSMAKSPEERYKDAEQFARVLRAHTIPVGSSVAVPGGSMSVHGGSVAQIVGASMTGVNATGGVSSIQDRRSIGIAIVASVLIVGALVGIVLWLTIFQSPTPLAVPVAEAPPPAEPRPQARRQSGPEIPVVGSEDAPRTSDRRRDEATINWANVRPVDVFVPTQRERILELATAEAAKSERERQIYGVEGIVNVVEKSPSGRVANIYFRDALTEGDFRSPFFPQTFEAMGQKFGGDVGEPLAGKKVRIIGSFGLYRGNPQIIVESPDQVIVLD